MERPQVHRVLESTGPDHAVVYVRGWLSKHSDREHKQQAWAEAIRAAGWSGAVYHLWWDGKGKASRDQHVVGGVAAGAGVGALAGPVGVFMGTAVGGLAGGGAGLGVHFGKSHRRAKKTGRKYAADAIAEGVTEASISLVGFSLGARLIYSLLAKGHGGDLPVADVVLLGGAIRRDSSHDWEGAADAIAGSLVNLHSERDPILKLLLKNRRFGQAACGLKPIKNKKEHPRIFNVDVSDKVHEHDGLAYMAQVPRAMKLLTTAR